MASLLIEDINKRDERVSTVKQTSIEHQKKRKEKKRKEKKKIIVI